MDERRRCPRSALPQDLTLYDSERAVVIGTLADLSSDGLRVKRRQPVNSAVADSLSRGGELDMTLLLPEGWAELSELDFTAQCRWWDADPDSGFDDSGDETTYQAGFQIVDISDTEAFLIQEILDLYGNPLPED